MVSPISPISIRQYRSHDPGLWHIRVTAQTIMREALRDVVGPEARAHGYKGAAPTWRKTNDSGDWAVVNIQSSSWSTSDQVRCVVNLAVAPEPWLRWERENLGAAMPKAITESLGLYRVRLHPSGTPEGTDGWWNLDATARSALAAATDMITQLDLSGWHALDRMMMSGGMLEQVRRGNLGDMKRENFGVYFARAEALLLMDNGPSTALDERLSFALENVIPRQGETAQRFDEWVRAQAQEVRQ